ncbi:hypothetical protein CsSME_00025803 [Camellia sinensis var. sinensis]
MSEINLDETFWEELRPINLDDILAKHPAPASPEGWGDSEDIIRRLHSGLAQLMGRPIYIQTDPTDVPYLLWRQSRAYTRGCFLRPTRVLGITPRYDRPHYIVGPLPSDFVARRGNVYPEDYIFTTVPNSLEIINIQNVDFSNDLSYIETPNWIIDLAFLGYI